MKRSILANILSALIPSKNLRHRLRKWEGFQSRYSKLESELAVIKKMIAFSKPVSEIPPAQGLIRGIQLLMLDKMKEIARLFDANGIDYWLDFGTLLGAVRHKGFVPWDEDMDIAIDRGQRETVIQLFRENGIDFHLALGGNSLLQVNILKLKGYNVHIDIMGYKKVPKISETGVKVANQIMLHANKKFAYYSESYHKGIIEKLNNLEKEEKGELDVYVRCVESCERYSNYVVDSSDIFPLISIPYEDTSFKVPAKYAEYLTDIYTDYMQWPSQIVSNNIFSRMNGDSKKNLISVISSFLK